MSEKRLIEDPAEIRLTDREEIEAILGRPPGWLLHSGNLWIFIFITIVLGMGFYFEYPDTIQTKVSLVSDTPPVRLAPKTNGKLVYLLDTDTVQKNTVIAVLENAGDWRQILHLQNNLDWIENQIGKGQYPETIDSVQWKLGTLQQDFSQLSYWTKAHFRFLKTDRTARKLTQLNKQIEGTERLNDELRSDKEKLAGILAQESEKFKRIDQLYQTGDKSREDWNNARIEQLNAERNLDGLQSKIYANEIRMDQLKREILDLKDIRSNTEDDSYLKAKSAILNLRGAIENWEQSFVIRTPISGFLSKPNILHADQFLKRDELIFTIIPPNQGIYGLAEIGQESFGKVKYGAPVKIWMLGYPYQEFGAIDGIVSEINELPENDLYKMKIKIPETAMDYRSDSLYIISTFNKSLLVRQEMTGVGNIITEKSAFISRIFNRIRSTFDN